MEENLNTENPMQKYAWQLKTMSHIHSFSLNVYDFHLYRNLKQKVWINDISLWKP